MSHKNRSDGKWSSIERNQQDYRSELTSHSPTTSPKKGSQEDTTSDLFDEAIQHDPSVTSSELTPLSERQKDLEHRQSQRVRSELHESVSPLGTLEIRGALTLFPE